MGVCTALPTPIIYHNVQFPGDNAYAIKRTPKNRRHMRLF